MAEGNTGNIFLTQTIYSTGAYFDNLMFVLLLHIAIMSLPLILIPIKSFPNHDS